MSVGVCLDSWCRSTQPTAGDIIPWVGCPGFYKKKKSKHEVSKPRAAFLHGFCFSLLLWAPSLISLSNGLRPSSISQINHFLIIVVPIHKLAILKFWEVQILVWPDTKSLKKKQKTTLYRERETRSIAILKRSGRHRLVCKWFPSSEKARRQNTETG